MELNKMSNFKKLILNETVSDNDKKKMWKQLNNPNFNEQIANMIEEIIGDIMQFDAITDSQWTDIKSIFISNKLL